MRLILAFLILFPLAAQVDRVLDDGDLRVGKLINEGKLFLDYNTGDVDVMAGKVWLNERLVPEWYTALYTFGPSLSLNPTATTFDAPVNLLACSDDMTCGVWNKTNATANSATLLTPSAQYGREYQSMTTSQGQLYTYYVRARLVSGFGSPRLFHENSASGNSSLMTFTGSLADYAVAVLGRTGGGVVSFGIADYNATPTSQYEITRQAVYPGIYTAEQAAAIYEKTAANRESITDWTGNGNTLCNGGNCSTTSTNSASNSVGSYNLLAAGSTDFSSDWTTYKSTTASAGDGWSYLRDVTDTTEHSMYQAIPATTGNRIFSVYVKADTLSWLAIGFRAGDNSFKQAYFNAATGTFGTTDASITTAVEALGSGEYRISARRDCVGDYRVYLWTASADGVYQYLGSGQQVLIRQPQLERVPTGTTTPLPWTDSASPVLQCVSCDLTTDDYLKVTGGEGTGNLSAGDSAIIAVFRTESPGDIFANKWVSGAAGSLLFMTYDGVLRGHIATSAGNQVVNGTRATQDGLWHIGAQLVKNGRLYVYTDGGDEQSVTISGSQAVRLQDWTIGFRNGATPSYFNGQIPLVLIEDRAMTSRELIGNGSCSASSTASESRLLRQCGLMGLIAWEYWNKRAICVTGYRALGFCASAPTELP